MSDRISEAELVGAELSAEKIAPLDGSTIKRLVAEVRRLREILDGVYDLVQETKGREQELAELELEVAAIREERRRSR